GRNDGALVGAARQSMAPPHGYVARSEARVPAGRANRLPGGGGESAVISAGARPLISAGAGAQQERRQPRWDQRRSFPAKGVHPASIGYVKRVKWTKFRLKC